jgi:uncharacterized protein (TIGR03790 family)
MARHASGAIRRAAFLAGLLASGLTTGIATSAEIAPGARVLLVINDNSPVSRTIGEYYSRKRGVPITNQCHVKAPVTELIRRPEYEQLAAAISECLHNNILVESVYYIVTTLGVPLKIDGRVALNGDAASVDSELTLLYQEIKGAPSHRIAGSIPNPFFNKTASEFSHPEFPIYMVTRLAAYDFAGVRDMIDRGLQATNRGKFIIDLRVGYDEIGDKWLEEAAAKLPKDRVVLDNTNEPLYDQVDVIAYASFGSNDRHHNRRFPNFKWLPGGIATEFVSTDARTFQRPPDNWVPSWNWGDKKIWFDGSPQALTADFILEGATGASGHTEEPYLAMNPHPNILLPAYYSGRNLAESFYLSIPALSWQNVVVGDPLCSLGKPK